MPAERGLLELSVTVGNASFSASGETQVVLDAYADFKEYAKAVPAAPPSAPPPPSPSRATSGDRPGSGSTPLAPAPAAAEVKAPTSLPLKPYLERLKLRSNKEKAAALVAWSAESGEKAALTVSEIEQLWRRSPFKVPKNVPRDVRAAEAEGWLDSEGKEGSPSTTYRINGFGEGIVVGWVKAEE